MMETKEIYFDNSATTKASDGVIAKVTAAMGSDYGNPSSLHRKGMEAERYVKTAREQIAKILKVEDKEILFTSGGTESNNTAIIGAARANRRSGNHIITTAVEHASVANVMKYLEEEGFRVTYLPVDSYGVVSVADFEAAICENTILASIMYVNNEVGAIMPVEQMAKVLKEKRPDALFHVDAIQAFAKFQIYPKRMGIDLMSVSGHKFHGPKGVGFLYVRNKVKMKPLLLGGGQQNNMRSGTENVPGIAGLGQACVEAYDGFADKVTHMTELKDYFIEQISKTEGVAVNSRMGEAGAPHIVSVSFQGVRSEVLLHALEELGIYVSAGSACSSNKPAISATLQAMKIPKEYLDSTIRFSFCEANTKEEIDYCISNINTLLCTLRKYRRK
jgi:cysteine desulfurase